MPAFFRESIDELAYLCSEPDRWRDRARSPALSATTGPDHWMHMENVPQSLPATRYQFMEANVGRKNAAGRPMTMEDLGGAAYAMTEYAEMLSGAFRRWRQATENTPEEQRVRRQMERSIIHVAGVLCHYVTDTAQPLHATVHHNGWDTETPNPRKFEGKAIHRRFETDFVDANIAEQEIAARVGKVHSIAAWLPEAERHLRASQSFVERVYEFDQQVAFGSGKEPAEAKDLTVRRLVAGAEQIRNFWHAAWVKSQ